MSDEPKKRRKYYDKNLPLRQNTHDMLWELAHESGRSLINEGHAVIRAAWLTWEKKQEKQQ